MTSSRVVPVLTMVAALLVAACAPAAAPSPTAAPAKPAPTAAPAKPAEAKPAAKPTEAPAAKPAEAKPAASPAAKVEAKPAAASLAGKKIRVGETSAPDFGDSYQAILKQKITSAGGTFENTAFNSQDPAVKALLLGEIDFLHIQLNSLIPLNQAGSNFRSLIRVAANEWSLVTPVAIKVPTDLNGKRIGIHGPNTLTEQLVKSTVNKYNLNANVLVVPGSEARIQALVAGQLDASPAELKDVFALDRSKPGQYSSLIRYSKDLAFLTGSTLVAKKEFIDQNPELLQTVIDLYAETMAEMMNNPESAKKAAIATLPNFDQSLVDPLLKEYYAIDYWNPALTMDTVTGTLKFMQDNGILKGAAPAPDSIVDLRFWEKAKSKYQRR